MPTVRRRRQSSPKFIANSSISFLTIQRRNDEHDTVTTLATYHSHYRGLNLAGNFRLSQVPEGREGPSRITGCHGCLGVTRYLRRRPTKHHSCVRRPGSRTLTGYEDWPRLACNGVPLRFVHGIVGQRRH